MSSVSVFAASRVRVPCRDVRRQEASVVLVNDAYQASAFGDSEAGGHTTVKEVVMDGEVPVVVVREVPEVPAEHVELDASDIQSVSGLSGVAESDVEEVPRGGASAAEVVVTIRTPHGSQLGSVPENAAIAPAVPGVPAASPEAENFLMLDARVLQASTEKGAETSETSETSTGGGGGDGRGPSR